MPTNKRRPAYCLQDAEPPCGRNGNSRPDERSPDDFAEKVFSVLADQDAVASFDAQGRLIDFISRAVRARKAIIRQWSKNRKPHDIIGLIQAARDSGDFDEAIWRCFLAAHFGRASASTEQVHSASDFLCAFEAKPYWTWQRASDSPETLRVWLTENARKLQSLSYGNHRKYESKQPEDIWEVVESFVALAEESGGPMKLMTTAERHGDAGRQLDELLQKQKPVRRFGRKGRFDFLALLIDLQLVSAEPVFCYLRGATGPLAGA